MIPLHPVPNVRHACPSCRELLAPVGWKIPGMRNLADLVCGKCRREFYGDLAAGQAVYTPLLIEKETGIVHDVYNIDWFGKWLGESYASRTDRPVTFDVQERLPVQRSAVLLNCIDTIYGHSLLKLLNAQRHIDHHTDVSLIIVVPKCLEWMLPEGVTQAWVVDLPFRRGTEWNEWLAREISERLQAFTTVSLSRAFSHPHPHAFDIERFTRVKPFALDEWANKLEQPTVTFIWRDDRLWRGVTKDATGQWKRFTNRFTLEAQPLEVQAELVAALAGTLREECHDLDFAVTGLGRSQALPDSIADLRHDEPDAEIERRWCERYASSHVVVGMHGSNMLLPSAHAGGVVELIGEDRWGNFLQDILFRESDAREMFFRYRFVEETMNPVKLANLVISIVRRLPEFRCLMNPCNVQWT